MSHETVDDSESLGKRVAVSLLGRQGSSRVQEVKRHWQSSASSTARRLTPEGRRNAAVLRSLHGRHEGQRCVIIGNGPSLNQTDLSLLRHEHTFGLNRIYLMFDKLGFATTYHVVINALVMEQCGGEIRRLEVPTFTTYANRRFVDGDPRLTYVSSLSRPAFSTDLVRGVWEGATVTFVAMQLAHWMGFAEVVLVGVDHNFASKGPAHQAVVSGGDDPNHFDPNYFGKGFKWNLPDLETSEMAYAMARDAYERDGRRIVDATVGGKLRVFKRSTLESELG